MIKNSLISVIPQEENKGSVEFQVLTFTNKIRRLTSHLELHKKDFFYLKEVYEKFWKNINDYWLICQRKM